MLYFFLKALASGFIISFASWLSLKKPALAGFIIAMPLISMIAISFSYHEHKNFEQTILFAKSILLAIPVSLAFFVPFFLSKSWGLNFLSTYLLGLFLLIIGYFIHKFITDLL